MLVESNKVELKVKYTNQVVKEIVAFLNAEGGKIYIGVDNDGKVVGVSNIDQILRSIYDIVASQIEPSAQDMVKTELENINGILVVVIIVKKGISPLYCIKKYGFSASGCAIRVGSSSTEMDAEQIKERYKQRFFDDDVLASSTTNLPILSFQTLKNSYLEFGYKLNEETFETNLALVNSSGKYNKMAELLSDNNCFSLIFVKFSGKTKAALSQRSDYGNKSIIFGYRQLMNRIAAENICLSDTSVRPRKDTFLFNYDSVNEAIINAIVHNDWSIAEPQVSFFSDRIEILSHGGLPYNLKLNDFFLGISKPRNAKLMKIFSDLDIVDHTGHGVPIIIENYGKGVFKISDNYIIVSIPFNEKVAKEIKTGINVSIDTDLKLNKIEHKIILLLLREPTLTTDKIATFLRKTKRTAERYLKNLKEKGYIKREGTDKKGNWVVLK